LILYTSLLLLYKGGAQQSECKFNRIKSLIPEKEAAVFTADVSKVRDIHTEVGVDTALKMCFWR
jgi:hypothetical protein